MFAFGFGLGLQGAQLEIGGAQTDEQQRVFVEVGPDQSRELRALITIRDGDSLHGRSDIRISATDVTTGRAAMAKNLFIAPEK